MSWQTDLTAMVRVLINDIDSPQLYTDTRLQQVIIVSSQLVNQDVNFPNNYIVDIANTGITPDPTVLHDESFVSLVSLRSACLIDNSTLRTKAESAGISVKTGPHSIDTKGVIDAYKFLLEKGYCDAYQEAKWEYISGNSAPGRAILGPFAGINLDTDYGAWYYGHTQQRLQ